jgi:hypothetical protein
LIAPVTGLAARNQFGGKVWLRKNEPMMGRVASFVVPGKCYNHAILLREADFSTVGKQADE